MPARSPRPSWRNSGFVLLHALWLLLAASALASGVLALALQRSTELASLERETRLALAQDAAIELAIHDILTLGARSRWVRAPLVAERLAIDELRIVLTVQNVAGLLDAGAGDVDLLATLFGRHLGTEGEAALRRIDAARRLPERGERPFSGYADLWATAAVPEPGIACLYPHITLFSGRSAPDPSMASDLLMAMLSLQHSDSANVSALEGTVSPAGATYRLEAVVETGAGEAGGGVLSAEVTVTGNLHPSHVVRSWLRLPRNSARSCR